MGAATAIIYCARSLSIRAACFDSPYSNFESIIQDIAN